MKFLSFRNCGHSNYSNWRKNKSEFKHIITAVNQSGLKESLKTLDLFNCSVDCSDLNIGDAEIVKLNAVTPTEE